MAELSTAAQTEFRVAALNDQTSQIYGLATVLLTNAVKSTNVMTRNDMAHYRSDGSKGPG
jgi:hypothetical protein